MLHTLIQINYLPILAIIYMFIFIQTNPVFDFKITRKFYRALVLILILIFADGVEYYAASLPYPTSLRIWMSAIGYSIRPCIVYMILMLFSRNKRYKRYVRAIPVIFNVLVAFSALFTDIAYSYSSSNEFMRGPLGYTAFVVSGYYLVTLLVETVSAYKDKNMEEAFIVFFIVISCTVATAMESNGRFDALINGTGALSITYYYFYLNTQQFKRDPLTNALNRSCFKIDGETKAGHLVAVIAFDLNNLKQLNDRNGHAEGDRALCSMVDCIRRAMRKGCRLYRTGGDEFTMLCFETPEEQIGSMIAQIRQNMEQTPYRCAFGAAYAAENRDFGELCERADQEMYKNKLRMKQFTY